MVNSIFNKVIAVNDNLSLIKISLAEYYSRLFPSIASQAYKVQFEMNLMFMRRPLGHGFNWDQTDQGLIHLQDGSGNNHTYKLFHNNFNYYANGVIWNHSGTSNDQFGLTYRINTSSGYTLRQVVSEYMNNPGKYAIDCGALACLSSMAVLLDLFDGLLDMHKLSRQEALISSAINYIQPDLKRNRKHYFTFNRIGSSNQDMWKAKAGDIIFIKLARVQDPMETHALTVSHYDRGQRKLYVFDPHAQQSKPIDFSEGAYMGGDYQIRDIMRIDVHKFLNRYGLTSVKNNFTSVQKKFAQPLWPSIYPAVDFHDNRSSIKH